MNYGKNQGKKTNTIGYDRTANYKRFHRILRKKFNKSVQTNRKIDSGISQKEAVKKYLGFVKMIEKTIQKQLKDVQLKAVLSSELFFPALSDCLNTIKNQANKSENEATIESAFEISLYGFLKSIGIEMFPTKEKPIETIRHIKKGRMDSQIGALVIEFKHKDNLKTEKQIEKATEQISNYLHSLSKKETDNYFLGVITDGLKIKFLKCYNQEIFEETIHSLTVNDLQKLIKNIVSLETKSLSAKNLVEEFCHPKQNNISTKLVNVLYSALNNTPTHKTYMLNSEWERLFKLGHEDKSHQQKIEERAKVLGKIVGKQNLEMSEQYKILFCLQTTYAIIVKLIAYRVLSDIVFKSPLISFESLQKGNIENLRIFLANFEEGSTFREIGIDNLLEGDFFSWYCSKEQWNEEIYETINEIIRRLADYENKPEIFHKLTVNDMFRELYQNIMPNVVRYSLGEYYTPKWLAQHVLDNSIKDKKQWKGLDPCCGSGTFVVAMIEKVVEETIHLPKEEIFHQILNRVKAIDLNPLAVLTARVNYFIAISPFLPEEITYFEIPVYLGDSANPPKKIQVDGVECLSYVLKTKLDDIEIILPKSLLENQEKFSKTMYLIEDFVAQNENEKAIDAILTSLPKKEKTKKIVEGIHNLVNTLIDLEVNKWDHIWGRIIKNFLTTVSLGKFEVIIGNPPWIDWKNLPTGYRNQIKSLCISKELFSGDKLTGGINLNICALIANVVAETYLDKKGTFGFLMPKSILFQQTYDGFRKLKLEKGEFYLQEVHDWTKAGSPFYPVQQQFMTYYFGFKKNAKKFLPVKKFIQNKGADIKNKQTTRLDEMKKPFEIKDLVAGQLSKKHTAYTFAENEAELQKFKIISGECHYIGREGIEFYPQEIVIFSLDKDKPKTGKNIVWVKNYQNTKSKYKTPQKSIRLEKNYLYPLLKGVDIKPFEITDSEFLVPFPYDKNNPKIPIDEKQLSNESPLLLKHFREFKDIIKKQTEYNEKIKGKYNGVFYSFTRVGKYTFAPVHVVFRDNTKWCSAISTKTKMPWGEEKRRLFQNHAVSICERKDGSFITTNEAHYICAILNAPISEKFILQSSDSRTFKIRPPLKIPKFDSKNEKHLALLEYSKQAHKNPEKSEEIKAQINEVYIRLCSE